MAKLGSITINEIEIIEVDVSPIGNLDAADGSICIITTGSQMWYKTSTGVNGWSLLDKSYVGLSNVDNISDLNKPVSTLTQTALDLKANLSGGNTFSGGQLINGSLGIISTTNGFLPPRMTSIQRNNIASPSVGLLVFDTDLGTLCEYSGTTWKYEFRLLTTTIQSSTGIGYVNVTQLTSLTLDVGIYVLELKGIAQSTSTVTGIGLRLSPGTATISTMMIDWQFSQGTNGTAKNFTYNQLSAADNITSASVVTANANFPIFGNGVFRLTSGGTIVIQMRTETAGIAVSIRPDTTLMLKKIG